ncbi:MAG: hypothetical protein KAR11_08910 [Phycisphaerae bacterium]|nr:hypothetical protein [Phycisphaerae bacterium]
MTEYEKNWIPAFARMTEAKLFTWTLDIPYWVLDIRFLLPVVLRPWLPGPAGLRYATTKQRRVSMPPNIAGNFPGCQLPLA